MGFLSETNAVLVDAGAHQRMNQRIAAPTSTKSTPMAIVD
jgi:hypothetical protein